MSLSKLVLANEEKSINYDSTEPVFLLGGGETLPLDVPFSHKNILEYLTYQIVSAPKSLILHTQRIHYCFRESLSEQLFAALIDLFIATRGRDGAKYAMRMFNGANSRLTAEHKELFQKILKKGSVSINEWPVNRYSVLGRGITGKAVLVKQIQTAKPAKTETKDPLALAQDYIEYSQLDEAREVLEAAILEQPEREDLTEELLGLYKSTRDIKNFKIIYKKISEIAPSLQDAWDDLNSQMTDK